MAEEPKTPRTPAEEPLPTAGQSFVKAIRPLGCALFLVLFVLVTAVCFSSAKKPIPGYEPPHDTAYYAADLPALVQELEENVFPALEYPMTAEITGDVITVTVGAEDFFQGRAAVLRYFDQSLFTFEEDQ